jgi:diacylglycerol kinase
MKTNMFEGFGEFMSHTDANQSINQIENDIAGLNAKHSRLKQIKNVLFSISAILFVTFLIGIFSQIFAFEISIVLLIISGALFILFLTINSFSIEAEINKLKNQKSNIQKLIKDDGKYFVKLVEININNLSEYYLLVKSQANLSFLTSIGAGISGFLLICIGLILGFDNENNIEISYLATTSGILTEFIATTFFYLYNKTVRQLKEYHDSLIDVQNVLLAFKLIDDISIPEDKAKTIQKMVEFLVRSK